MRLIAALLLVATTTLPAYAGAERILEPTRKMTLEQQVNTTASKSYGRKSCQQVQRQRGFFAPALTFLIDADGTKSEAEYKFQIVDGTLLRASRILADDHPSKCKMAVFVADIETGKIDVGAYQWCGKDNLEEVRYADAYYWDRTKKQRVGHEHKLRWDIEFRRMMWRTDTIAAKC